LQIIFDVSLRDRHGKEDSVSPTARQ